VKKFIIASVMFVVFALTGCLNGSSDGGGDSQQQTNTGGSSSNSPGGTGGSGSGDGGSGDSTGGGTGGGTGSSGGSSGTIYGTFASLYTGSSVFLNILNCTAPTSGGIIFQSAVFRPVNQTGNNVDAAITLKPHPSFASQFDQLFVTANGAFLENGSFNANITTIFSLAGNVVARGQGSIDVTFDNTGSVISVDFVPDTIQQTCNLSGSFFLTETPDTGGGGTSGGGSTGGDGSGGGTSGGGTGGSSGGGTSTSSPGGTILIDYGQFGTLQMQSSAFPADDGTFEMTTVQYTNSAGFETFSWASTQGATVNIYPSMTDINGDVFSNTTFNSSNDRSYACRCIPVIDLINNEVVFSNLVLTATKTPGATVTIDGVVSYP